MAHIKLIGLPVAIAVLSFGEILVFNEEILLTLCFIAFLFYIYTSLGQSTQKAFEDAGFKIEVSFLQSAVDQSTMLLSAMYAHVMLWNQWIHCLAQVNSWSLCIIEAFRSIAFVWSVALVTTSKDLLTRKLSFESTTVQSIGYFNTLQTMFSILPSMIAKDNLKSIKASSSSTLVTNKTMIIGIMLKP